MKNVVALCFLVVVAADCKQKCDGDYIPVTCGDQCLPKGTICCNQDTGVWCSEPDSCSAAQQTGADTSVYSDLLLGNNCVSTASTGGAGGTSGDSTCRSTAVSGTCLVLENQCNNNIVGACACAAACVDAVCGDANSNAEKDSGDSARRQGFSCSY